MLCLWPLGLFCCSIRIIKTVYEDITSFSNKITISRSHIYICYLYFRFQWHASRLMYRIIICFPLFSCLPNINQMNTLSKKKKKTHSVMDGWPNYLPHTGNQSSGATKPHAIMQITIVISVVCRWYFFCKLFISVAILYYIGLAETYNI